MLSQNYLSYQAQKYFWRVAITLGLVFTTLGFANWSRLRRWLEVGPEHIWDLAKLIPMVSLLAGYAAAAAIGLFYDFVTQQGMSDPARRRVTGEKTEGLSPAGEASVGRPLPAPEELGPVFYSQLFAKQVDQAMLRLFAVILVLPAIPMGFAALGEFPMSLYGPLISAALLFAVYHLWRANPMDRTLRVRRDGVECVSGAKARAYRWGDITGVRDGTTLTHGTTLRTCTIRTSDSQEFRVANVEPKTADGFVAMTQILRERTGALLLKRAEDALRARRRVDFGPLAVDEDELHFGVRSMPRSEIVKAELERGTFAVYRRGEARVPFAAPEWSEMWNPIVLLALLNPVPPEARAKDVR